MTEHYASGSWRVSEGKESEFRERWAEFLVWSRETTPGLVTARLLRDRGDPRHVVSFAAWTSAEAREAWRQNPGFAERFGACRALCDDVYGADYDCIVSV
jgi:Uncharacterized enzyme involved in biosynthesis of extracellular polysaccharides